MADDVGRVFVLGVEALHLRKQMTTHNNLTAEVIENLVFGIGNFGDRFGIICNCIPCKLYCRYKLIPVLIC